AAATVQRGTGEDFLVARFNPDGSLDNGGGGGSTPAGRFGTPGMGAVGPPGPPDEGMGPALHPGGGGGPAGSNVGGGGGAAHTHPSTSNMAVARLDANGQLDRTFSGDGYIRTIFNSDSHTGVTGLVLLPSGGIVAAGYTRANTAGSPASAALVQYRANGMLDTT